MIATETKPRGLICKAPQIHALLNGGHANTGADEGAAD